MSSCIIFILFASSLCFFLFCFVFQIAANGLLYSFLGVFSILAADCCGLVFGGLFQYYFNTDFQAVSFLFYG